MDIGDILFLLIMGIGFLSSIGGAAKKKKRGTRPPAPPRSRVPQDGSPPQPARKSRLQEAREQALSQMEELLRDLDGGDKPQPLPTPTSQTPPAEVIVESPDVDLPPPVPVARDLPPSVPAPRDGTLHKKFHDKYIQPIAEVDGRSTTPRATRHLSQKSLRKAVLLKEILGPPKGLR